MQRQYCTVGRFCQLIFIGLGCWLVDLVNHSSRKIVHQIDQPATQPAPKLSFNCCCCFILFFWASYFIFLNKIHAEVCLPAGCPRASFWQETTLTITANLDDTIAHKDELHVIVPEGKNRLVSLSAKGTGTTLWYERGPPVLSRLFL